MSEAKSSVPKESCVNCHFLIWVVSTDHPSYSYKYSDADLEDLQIRKVKINDIDYRGREVLTMQRALIKQEEKYSNVFGDLDLLLCYEGQWKESPAIGEVDYSRSDKERHKRVVEKDRIGCLKFFEYEHGMELDVAREHRDKKGNCEFVLSDEVWAVSYEDKTINLQNSKGLQYIHYLMENPNKEITAIQLVREMKKSTLTKGVVYKNLNEDQLEGQLIEEGLALASSDAIGEIIDSEAIKDYKDRIQKLERELDDAEELSKDEEAATIKGEIEQVNKQLTAGLNKHGQLRKTPHEAEKARKAVSKVINKSLDKIKDDTNGHPVLWKHFHCSLTIGALCSYKPEKPIPWSL
jgi:hypothetical protein